MILYAFSSNGLFGSDERSLIPNVLKLGFEKYNLMVEVRVMNNDGVGVTAGIRNQVLRVPASELDGITHILMETVRVSGYAATDGDVSLESVRNGGFVLSFSFGKGVWHGIGDDRRELVFPHVKIYFGHDGYERLLIERPFGRFQNKWEVIIKELGEVGKSGGILDSVEYPNGHSTIFPDGEVKDGVLPELSE